MITVPLSLSHCSFVRYVKCVKLSLLVINWPQKALGIYISMNGIERLRLVKLYSGFELMSV